MNDDERPITLDEALAEVRELAERVGSQHLVLGAALVLLVRCAPFARSIQHRLLTAAAAMIEIAELRRRRPWTDPTQARVCRSGLTGGHR